MNTYVVVPIGGNCSAILRVDGPRAEHIGITCSNETTALRIAHLLDHHGLTEVPTEALPKEP